MKKTNLIRIAILILIIGSAFAIAYLMNKPEKKKFEVMPEGKLVIDTPFIIFSDDRVRTGSDPDTFIILGGDEMSGLGIAPSDSAYLWHDGTPDGMGVGIAPADSNLIKMMNDIYSNGTKTIVLEQGCNGGSRCTHGRSGTFKAITRKQINAVKKQYFLPPIDTIPNLK